MPLFQNLCNISPVASMVVRDGIVHWINNAAAELLETQWAGLGPLGHSPAIGRPLGNLVPTAVASLLLNGAGEGAETEPFAFEEGGGLFVARSAYIPDHKGDVGVFIQAVEGEEKIPTELILDAAPVGLVMVDSDGVIELANREIERQFGYESGELLGKTIEALLPPRIRTEHPTLRRQYMLAPSPRRMGEGRELSGRRKDGTEFPVEIGLTPLNVKSGDTIIASIVDVSERIRLESNFRSAFRAAPCGMAIVGDDGHLLSVNARLAAMFGYEEAELTNLPLTTLIPLRYHKNHSRHLKSYHASRSTRAMGPGRDLTGLHRDGTEVLVEIGLSPIRTDGGMATLALVVDISKRKAVENNLRRANANLEEFTYVASHDLKSPLRGISDLVEWIDEDLGDSPPPEVVKNLGRVGVRVRRMERLIDDLLAYARAGQIHIDPETVTFTDLLEDLLEIQPLPQGFELHTCFKVQTMDAPLVPLQTVLRNLISNAVKHHDRSNGRIEIQTWEEQGNCIVTVSDDGPGISAQARTRVFRLFETVTSSQRGDGGVGLAVTKRLVESHGGHIEALGRGELRGVTMKVSWPQFRIRG